MFRQMRRNKQALPEKSVFAVLERGTSGVLALYGDEDYPYAVPLSYVYRNGKLYFHCAKSGHKLDAIRRNCKASFCVVDQDLVVPETYTTYFRSVIAFGRIRILTVEDEIRSAMLSMAEKYAPSNTSEAHVLAISKDWAPLCVLEMEIDHLTGKEAIELVRHM